MFQKRPTCVYCNVLLDIISQLNRVIIKQAMTLKEVKEEQENIKEKFMR